MPSLSPRRFVVAALFAISIPFAPHAARAIPPPGAPIELPDGFTDLKIVGGLALPTAFDFVPGGRVLLAERVTGRVRLVVNGAYAATDPVLVVDSVEAVYGERGLLGLAVDPRWPASPYVYVHYTHRAFLTKISRYEAVGDLDGTGNGAFTLDPASRYDLVHIVDQYGIHNGGSLRFGPDSTLYSSYGDDGDPCAGQNLNSPYGRILRFEVRSLPPGPGGPPSLAALVPADNPFAADPRPWARLTHTYGLRNPFNFHVDPVTRDLFIADVGQLDWEEFDWAPAAGLQFGWGWYEGPLPTGYSCPADSTGSVPPIYSYHHADTLGRGESAISAGVYRAPPGATTPFPPSYDGDYFISDFYGVWIKRMQRVGNTWVIAPPEPGQPNADTWGSGFGLYTNWLVGPDGALWYCSHATTFTGEPSGELRRIVHDGVTGVAWREADPGLELEPPHPSPSRGAVTFRFALAVPGHAELAVLDVAGRRIATPAAAGWRVSGPHSVTWDGRDTHGRAAPAGLYVAVLRGEQGTVALRFVRLD